MHNLNSLARAAGALVVSTLSFVCHASSPDWSAGVTVQSGGRSNIYNRAPADFETFVQKGKIHAQVYPVSVTGVLPPYEPFRRLAEENDANPLKGFINSIFKSTAGIKNFDEVLQYLGLHPYPLETDQGVYQAPYPGGVRPDSRLGFGLIERDKARGFTFSCAACHSGNLFGKTVLGLTNRFPRANDFFVDLIPALSAVNGGAFQLWTHATAAETRLLESSRESLRRVQAKRPIALGLDTSLAQVALSLNRREEDEYATPSDVAEAFPRADEILDDSPADSKPAVWWNLKYKNRWLSDGSVVSGNPIYTNLIWNEVGRGVDLHKLEKWLGQNQKVIEELTSAVFASEAPKYTDFFPADKIDLELAKKGEKLFEQSCAKCHGHYEKAWSSATVLPPLQALATTLVRPPAKTFVVDVGTDPYRYQGMKSLEQLNKLALSKKNGVVIKAQEGYVPPPLVGIWARWPYFHNNSVPSLCAVLTPASLRPKFYYSGEANDPARDFDAECNGYPENAPAEWRTSTHLYDTRKTGMSNSGHDEGILMKEGREIFSAADKRALIQFLQTL